MQEWRPGTGSFVNAGQKHIKFSALILEPQVNAAGGRLSGARAPDR